MTETSDPEPDLLQLILQRVRLLCAPKLSDEQAALIEQSIRLEYGGERVRVARRRKHLSDLQRQQLFEAGLTDKTEAEITSEFKVHRSTLYRTIKRGRS